MDPDKIQRNQSQILTIPNAITLARILLVPLFMYLGWNRNRLIQSAVLLGFIEATDWIDGYLARKLDQTSTVGKIIDPSADRLLLVAAGVIAIHQHLIPIWLLIVIFAREVAVSSVVGTVALYYKKRLDVVYYGKVGTLLMMFGFPPFILAGADTPYRSLFLIFGYLFMIPGVLILFIALVSYIRTLVSLFNRRGTNSA